MSSRLKEARIKSGYNIDDIAKALYIKKQYLVALEEDNCQSIPGDTYVKGYMRLYAKYLNIELSQNMLTKDEHTQIPIASYNNKKNMQTKQLRVLVIMSILLLFITTMLYHHVLSNAQDIEVKSTIEFIKNSDSSC